MANPTAGIGHVSLVPRYDVQMEMRDRLSGCYTFIEPDIETISPMCFGDEAAGFLDRREDR